MNKHKTRDILSSLKDGKTTSLKKRLAAIFLAE
jgi:hypothetical protein